MSLLCLILAGVIWLPLVHLCFKPDLGEYRKVDGMAPRARELAARHLEMWTDPALKSREISRMRGSNAEWDFMGRTFLVLSLSNMCLRDPSRQEDYLKVIDAIILETIEIEKREGPYIFLMSYARNGSFSTQPPRSLFIDGEVALMIAARRLVQEREDYKPLLHERVNAMARYMEVSPVLSGESYPDECWMFCNAVALAAIKLTDILDGTDHSPFLNRWVETAKSRLVDSRTGLLISSYTLQGQPLDGPEGSSIWMVAHCLQIVDPVFAQDQYVRARKELGREVMGFAYAREWPASWTGPADIDSGPIIPGLEASAGSSGLALLGAASFHDDAYLTKLITSLNLGGFPIRSEGRLRYAAGNQVGDAVLLYSLVTGPLWDRARAKGITP